MYKPPHQKPKNTFIQSQKKVAALDDATAFPELTAKLTAQPKKPTETEVTKPQLDFKAKLETAQVTEAKKPEPIATKQKRWSTPDEIMTRLNDNYLKWKAEYIEEYGWDEYDRYYRFPNYDYEYFDKLDDKLERELEMEEMKEREKEQEDDFVTEDYEEYEKE
jgi:hypothetical protein